MPTVSNRCLRSVGVVSVSPQSWLALNRFLGPKGFSRHRIETNYLPSVASNQTHGSVPILPRVNIGGVWFRALNCFVATQSIFQGKGCNTQFVKIHSGLDTFSFKAKFSVSAARCDQNRCSIGGTRCWQEHSNRGIVDIGHPIALGFFRFVSAIFKARGSFRPQWNHSPVLHQSSVFCDRI